MSHWKTIYTNQGLIIAQIIKEVNNTHYTSKIERYRSFKISMSKNQEIKMGQADKVGK